MGEQIKNSSFQQHLMGGSVELLESKLGIRLVKVSLSLGK